LSERTRSGLRAGCSASQDNLIQSNRSRYHRSIKLFRCVAKQCLCKFNNGRSRMTQNGQQGDHLIDLATRRMLQVYRKSSANMSSAAAISHQK